jgi:hypothetical protein
MFQFHEEKKKDSGYPALALLHSYSLGKGKPE